MNDKLLRMSPNELIEFLSRHGKVVLTERTITISLDESLGQYPQLQNNDNGDCTPCTICKQTGFTTAGFFRSKCVYCTNGWVIKQPRPRF